MPSPVLAQRQKISTIGNYDVRRTNFGFSLGEGKRGCFFVVALMVGGGAFAILKTHIEDILTNNQIRIMTVEWWFVLALGLALSAIAIAIFAYRNYTEVDFKKREIRLMKGFFKAKTSDPYPLDGFENITITRELVKDSDSDDYIVYPVILNAPTGRNLRIASYTKLSDSLRLANDLAELSGIKAFDSTTETRLPITSSDLKEDTKPTSFPQASPKDIDDVNFVWDKNDQSLSRLSTGQLHGYPVFKITYPKPYASAVITHMMAIGFFIYIFGWRIDKTATEIIMGFADPRFMSSADVFFSSMMGGLFLAFLILIPLTKTVIMLLRPPYSAIIAISENGLYIHDPKRAWPRMRSSADSFKHMTIPYGSIKSLDIKTAKTPKSRKQWKIEKRENFIAFRAGNKLHEIAFGLDWDQLSRIATEIKNRMLRTPNPN